MSIKRILIPAIAGLLTSPAVLAAIVDDTVAGGPSTTMFISDEYLSTAVAASAVYAGDLAVELEAEYAVGDVITWSVTGGAVDSGFPSSVVFVCANPGNAGITFGLLSSDANGASYRVTELDTTCGSTSTVGAVINFAVGGGGPGALVLDAQAVAAAGTINAAYSAETSTGLALDTGGGASRNVDLVVTGSQIAPTVTAGFNAVVDVNQERLGFVTRNDGVTSCDGAVICDDIAAWTVDPLSFPATSDDQTFAGLPGAADDQVVTLNGNFGWVVDTDDTTAGIQFPGTTFAATNCTLTGLTATAASADCANGASTVTIDVFQNVDGAGDLVNPLPATTFTSDHVFAFTGIGGTGVSPLPSVASTTAITLVPLGAWTLNGFQAEVAYMPFQTGIGQVIYLANRGSQDGLVTVDWIDADGNSGSFDIGTLNAGSTKSIGPAINAGLPAAQRASGRLALTITANVPACDAQINAQYNVSGDRAFSVTRDNCD